MGQDDYSGTAGRTPNERLMARYNMKIDNE